MSDANPPPILIAGPTASGKSDLALALAERLGGVIVNADSMQVYRELRILTARPSPGDESRVPHRLYGFVPAAHAYSVGRFVADVAAALAEARGTGRRPILVGGTGLYFKALTQGLSPIPQIAAEVRRHWRDVAEQVGAAGLYQQLSVRDPVMAERLGPSDTQRLTRALEVIDGTGRSLADWQRLPGKPLIDEDSAPRLLINPDRAELHARTDARLDRMLEEGALEEARALAQLTLDGSLPAMRAIGVRPLLAAVRGEMDLQDAVSAAKSETRQYVKRQQTWIMRNMIAWTRVNTQQMESIYHTLLPFIQKSR